MKKLAVILFTVGLVLETVAFLVSNADDIPIVLLAISPSYARAMQGLDTLESGKELLPNMPGFSECAELYLSMLREQRPPDVVSGLSVTRFFHPPRVSQNFSVNRGVSVTRPLEVHLSNGEKVDSTLESLDKKISRLKRSDLLCASAGVFAIGVILQILGFVIERRSRASAAFYEDDPVKPSTRDAGGR